MSRRTTLATAAAVAVTAFAGGLILSLTERSPTAAAVAESTRQTLTQTQFIDLEGKTIALSDWAGTWRVVNFWATWCAPCREEIPAFVAIRTQFAPKELTIVGIAIDQRELVKPFAESLGINYPLLLGGGDTLDLMRLLGNTSGALPFTVFIDPAGRVVDQHLGPLTQPSLSEKLAKLRS